MLKALLTVLLAALVTAQEPPPAQIDWVCPMDPDVRAKGPGKCTKCGMALEPGIPDPVEYPVKLKTTPAAIQPGRPVELRFEVLDPKNGERVRKFQFVHEKLFHLFLISDDLDYFAHEHPEFGADSIFRFKTTLPKPGAYRVLCDFYPEGGAPQMVPKTLLTPGYQPRRPTLAADLSPQRGENMEVTLETEPPQPIAGKKTLLFFRVKPAAGLEQYLGAWGHLLAASDDLIDAVHTHPAIADGGPQIQFNLIFPREAVYRIWVQFQRQGKVNTVAFTLPVSRLK